MDKLAQESRHTEERSNFVEICILLPLFLQVGERPFLVPVPLAAFCQELSSMHTAGDMNSYSGLGLGFCFTPRLGI